jgi:hypothetical protein
MLRLLPDRPPLLFASAVTESAPLTAGSQASAVSTSLPCAIDRFSIARSLPNSDSSHAPMVFDVGL